MGRDTECGAGGGAGFISGRNAGCGVVRAGFHQARDTGPGGVPPDGSPPKSSTLASYYSSVHMDTQKVLRAIFWELKAGTVIF